MKVYLSACGMGVGHIVRCELIGEALTARGSDVIYSTYSDGEQYADRRRMPRISTVPLSLCMDADGAVDFKRTAATHPGFFRGIWLIIRQIVAEIRNIQACRPDVVVSDSRVSSVLASKLLRVPTVLVLNQYSIFLSKRSNQSKESVMDRVFFLVANTVWVFVRIIIGEFWSLADRIVIPDLPPPNTLSLQNLLFPSRHRHKVDFVGPLVRVPSCQREDTVLSRRELGLSQDKPLVFVPVSMPHPVRASFIRTFEGVLSEMREYEIVLSRCIVGETSPPTRNGNLLVYDWIDDPSEFFSACDVVVCRAGHGTIMAAILAGKPMVIVPIPNHPEQIRNSMRASALGVARVLPQSELDSQRLRSAIEEVLEDKGFAKRASEIQEAACHLDGLQSTLDVIDALGAKSD